MPAFMQHTFFLESRLCLCFRGAKRGDFPSVRSRSTSLHVICIWSSHVMTGTLRAKAVQNLRSRPTPLTRKKERIARRLGIVRRPGSAPTSRKKKNCVNEQDALVRTPGYNTTSVTCSLELDGWGFARDGVSTLPISSTHYSHSLTCRCLMCARQSDQVISSTLCSPAGIPSWFCAPMWYVLDLTWQLEMPRWARDSTKTNVTVVF